MYAVTISSSFFRSKWEVELLSVARSRVPNDSTMDDISILPGHLCTPVDGFQSIV